MNNRLTRTRLILAVITTGLEIAAIWAIGRLALPDLGIELPLMLLIAVTIFWAAFSTWLFIFTTRTLKKQAQAGLPSMIGTKGKVIRPLNPDGLVKIRGELWGAAADNGEIEVGEDVIVVGQNGLKLSVRKTGGGELNIKKKG
jgi:membrane-bound serine protease (ClpP class)